MKYPIPDYDWLLDQAQALSSSSGNDAVKALAWNLNIAFKRWADQVDRPPLPHNPEDRSIKGACFSTRTTNFCLNAGCETVDDLARWTEREVLRFPNIGRKGLDEMKVVLAGYGLRFADRPPA